MRIRSTALSAGVLVAIIGVAGMSGAVAGSMITGAQIKNGTVTGIDVKNGSLTTRDLSASTRTALRGASGPAGVSKWTMVQASSDPQPAGTPYPSISANCPTGTKLLSASSRWHIWNQSQVSVSYNPDGSGASATTNDGSSYNADYLDLTLICAAVSS